MAPADLEHRALAGDTRAQILLADRLDGRKRHDEAISWLSRAAKAGDAKALAALGLRLLVGRDAPLLPREGAGLLSDAARAGDAEAAAMIAVLAGGGFYGPQSWTAALDFLQRSAELGGSSARTQLRLLAGDPALAALAAAPHPPAEVWKQLRRSVDIAVWTSAPPATTLHPAPQLRAFEGLVSEEICGWVIAQSRPRLERALVQDPATGLTIMGQTRTNRIASFSLADISLLHLFIQARIAAAAGIAMEMMEAFAVLHYGPGEEASEHVDYLDPAVPAYAEAIARHGQRVATCLVYLNDGYTGGETAFPTLDIRHRGGAGDALVFHSMDPAGTPDPRSLHAGRPPGAGEKWLLSQFIRDRPRAGLSQDRR